MSHFDDQLTFDLIAQAYNLINLFQGVLHIDFDYYGFIVPNFAQQQ